jgi:hypothetical protein
MAKFGINVPEGLPAFSVADVEAAARKLADEKGEVCKACEDCERKKLDQKL